MLWAKRKAEKEKLGRRAELPLEQGHLAESASSIKKKLDNSNKFCHTRGYELLRNRTRKD